MSSPDQLNISVRLYAGGYAINAKGINASSTCDAATAVKNFAAKLWGPGLHSFAQIERKENAVEIWQITKAGYVPPVDLGRPMKAFVYRSGLVGFGEKTPQEALEVGAGPGELLKAVVSVVSRHAYNNEYLLCPGVPEATCNDDALDSVIIFREHIKVRMVHFLGDHEAAAEFLA